MNHKVAIRESEFRVRSRQRVRNDVRAGITVWSRYGRPDGRGGLRIDSNKVAKRINRQLVEFEPCVTDNGEMKNKIGRMIRAQLKALGRTQEWLAGEADISSNAVSKWIKTGKVSRENAVVVAEKLGLSVGQLLTDEDAGPKEKEPKKMALVYIDPTEVDLVTLYREATKEGRGMIFDAAEEAPKLLTPKSASINNDKT